MICPNCDVEITELFEYYTMKKTFKIDEKNKKLIEQDEEAVENPDEDGILHCPECEEGIEKQEHIFKEDC